MTDDALLHQYSVTGDPTAFQSLVDRYATFVFNVCLRVTGNHQDAEDVCQECFLELARKSKVVRMNLAGWLHSVATHRSLNVLRHKRREVAREKDASRRDAGTIETGEWNEIQPLVDKALNGLSDELRIPLIMHYFQSQSQKEVGEKLGVDQATVSRRLTRGLEKLRSRLLHAGVVTTAAAIAVGLTSTPAQAASTGAVQTLTKIGVSGIGGAIAKSAVSSLTSKVLFVGTLAANVGLLMITQGWLQLLLVVTEFALLMYPPMWVREMLRAYAFGRDVVASPMYPYRRWTWTSPPADWKQRAFIWAFVGINFGLVVSAHPERWRTQPGFMLAFVLMSAMFFWLATRLAMRVWRYRDHPLSETAEDQHSTMAWTSWETIGGCTFCAFLAGLWLRASSPGDAVSASLWLWFFVSVTMAVWALASRLHRKPVAAVPQPTKAQSNSYQHVLLGGLLLMTMLFLISGAAAQWSPRRPARRTQPVYRLSEEGSPVLMEMPHALKTQYRTTSSGLHGLIGGSMGLMFAVFLFGRTIKSRNQLRRPAYLTLIAVSALATTAGAALTVTAAKHEVPAPSLAEAERVGLEAFQRRQGKLKQLSPSWQDRVDRYATALKVVTLPEAQLPGTWYIRRNLFGVVDIPNEDSSFCRHVAQKAGLMDVDEFDTVTALVQCQYVRAYSSVDEDNPDSFCHLYGFCCENEQQATALQKAWGRGLVNGPVVMFAYDRRGLQTPSATSPEPQRSLYQHAMSQP